MALRLLIVDDNEDSREILALILGMNGFDIAQASDGIEALEQARAIRPNGIVTDIFMPRLDGIDFTRQLRADPALAAIPVVAQTAYVNAIDTNRDLFNAILEKPCQPSELLTTLASLGLKAS
jgi:two-component system, cell cycle response regulator DivK